MYERIVAMQSLGSVAFVSRLFLMCVKTVGTLHVILVRDFTFGCSQDASCIMLVVRIFLHSWNMCLIVGADIGGGPTQNGDSQQH